MPGHKRTRDRRVDPWQQENAGPSGYFLDAYDSADKEDLSRGYSLGAVDYIIKPLDPEALKSKVAVFVELYKKTEQVKATGGAAAREEYPVGKCNFERLGKLVELGQQLTAQRDPRLFCNSSASGRRHSRSSKCFR